MDWLHDRRVVIGMGALAAVSVGAVLALAVARDDDPATPPPAAQGGLQVEVGETDRAAIDPTRPLRCFVDGKFTGEATLPVCAARNGVSAQALDVGLDDTGALAAATDVQLDPVPPVDVAVDVPSASATASLSPLPDLGPVANVRTEAQVGGCISHGPNGWTTVSESASLDTCVTLLFDGRCQTPGNALYGRWGEQTVRLVPGKVEIATDGRTFTTLREQGGNCMLPPI